MDNLKVLVCGSVKGNFRKLFKKVNAVCQKSGPFDYLFCIGTFFGSDDTEWKDVLLNKISAPLVVYVLDSSNSQHCTSKTEELADNIFHLGNQGIFNSALGLKIAYLNGEETKSPNTISFSKVQVDLLISEVDGSGIDILLTCQCPKGVTKYFKPPMDFDDTKGSELIARLAKHIKPRYHFSAVSGTFFQMIPYRNHQTLNELPTHPTRFLALSEVINKSKWIYAFNIIPMSKVSLKTLIDPSVLTTECPYTDCDIATDKKKESFFYSLESSNENKRTRKENDSHSQSVRKKQTFSVDQEKCWFCFSNPDLEKQLLLSIGNCSYLTLAKGGIVDDHILIVPMEHIKSSVLLTQPVEEEIKKFKNSCIDYYQNNGKNVIFFERNYISAHLQIQVVPVPKMELNYDNIREAVHDVAHQHDLNILEYTSKDFSSLKKEVKENQPYFFMEVVINGKCELKFLHLIKKSFPLQFGRTVLCSEKILNLPQHVDWKSCKMSSEEELKIAKQFRESFKPYDFSS